MDKLMKRILSLVLVAVMMILPILNAIDVEAQEIPATYNFITGVKLTDLNDNPLGNDVEKDADLRLTYDHSIPNAGDVQVGDTFTLTIPNQIKIAVPGEFDIYDHDPVPNIIGIGTTPPVEINVNFDQPAPLPTSIEKASHSFRSIWGISYHDIIFGT